MYSDLIHLCNIRAGATLLYHSDPQAEEAETRLKASAFLGEKPGTTSSDST